MTTDTAFWIAGRSTGVAACVALSLALLSGIALRPGILLWFTHNRGLRAVHDTASLVWLPLGALHIVALLLDPQAHLAPTDVVVPFVAAYGGVAIGLGTISLWAFAIVMVTSWFRSRLTQRTWLMLHRLSYVGFAAVFAHVLLSGTDFGNPLLAAVARFAFLALCVAAGIRLFRGTRPGPARTV
jgi:predicted ferric reductase